MDPRRLRAGEWLAGLGGAALIASLFLPWYGRGPADLSGWEAFDAIDVVIAVLALGGPALAVLAATQRTTAIPIAFAALVTLDALVVAVIVLLRLLNLPEPASERDLGVYVGVGAALVMLAGGMAAMRDQRIPGRMRGIDPSQVETLPAPRP
jgi:hypothetical protein